MIDQETVSREKDDLEAQLKAFAEAAELDVTVVSEQLDGETLYFDFRGEDQDLFLTNKSDNLRGLGLLMQAVLEHRHPDTEIKVRVDAGGHLRKHEEELIEMATRAADGLENPGDEKILEPMNPFDRRIVHMALHKRGDLETESIGDGHFKRMIIRLVGETSGEIPGE